MFELELDARQVVIAGEPGPSRFAAAEARARGADVSVLPAASAVAALERGERPDLIVWVEGPAHERARLTEAAVRMRIPLASSKPHSSHAGGHVTLVGGGPGDADLMTVAGRDALANADVVLHDRLGPRDDLHLLAPAARLIDVGKTPGHHAVPQREIERLLLDNALDGHHVVRLKGGDPFVFGRGGEEVIACRSAGIPVTVIPGVTSAIAVPGAAGIPVTHREISRAFTVISGHVPLSENELEHAVGLGGTLVILMGVANLPHLTAGLQRHGMRRDMPLAVLERGFTPSRRTTLTTLSDAVRTASATGVASPAVIVIGEVVDALGDPEFAASLAEFA